MGKAGRKKHFERLSGQNVKALLGEVDVETECVREIQPPHDFKAHDVNQAQAPPGGDKQGMMRGFVRAFVHPEHVHEGLDIRGENADAFHADPVLKKRQCLHKDIVAGKKAIGAFEDFFPYAPRGIMLFIVRVQNGIKARSIHKDIHF